jgi:AraC-like DNA-binding protein
MAMLSLGWNRLGGQSIDSLLHTYMLQGQLRLAVAHAEQQLKPASGKLSPDQLVDYYNNLCEAYRRLGDFEKAEYYRTLVTGRVAKVRDSVVITCSQLVQAEIFMVQNHLDSAVTYLRKAQGYSERVGHKLLMSRIYRNFGGILLSSSKSEEAIQYYYRSYHISAGLPIGYNLVSDEMGIGMAYLAMAKPDSSLLYMKGALQHAQELGDTVALALVHALFSNFYRQQAEVAQAKYHLLLSIEMAGKTGHQVLMSNGYSMLMADEIAAKNYRQAIAYGLEARKRVGQNRIPIFEASIDNLLYQAYKGAGDYEKALAYFESFQRVDDEVQAQSHMDAIREQEKAFLLKEKNLKIENQQLQLLSSRRKQRVMVLIILLLVSAIAALILFGGLRKKYQRRLFRKEKIMEGIIASEKSKLQSSAQERIDRVDLANEDHDFDGELETFSEDRRDLYEEMLRIIEDQKLYLNPELNQKLLITLLGTNRKYLYQAISQNAEDNFKQIINRYRVNEAKRLIEERADASADSSLEDIHLLAGFNSVTSYYRAFKYFTGLTPRDYQMAYRQDYGGKNGKKGDFLS